MVSLRRVVSAIKERGSEDLLHRHANRNNLLAMPRLVAVDLRATEVVAASLAELALTRGRVEVVVDLLAGVDCEGRASQLAHDV